MDTTLDNAASVRKADLERRREIGQFFTPPPVADFVWKMAEIIHGGPFQGTTRVIDPACGDGAFLRVAAAHGIKPRALFGADIDERLVIEWQKDPLLQKARMQIGNGLIDHPDLGITSGSFNVVVGNPPFSGRGLRDLLRLVDDAAATTATEGDLFGGAGSRDVQSPPLRPPERGEFEGLVRQLSSFNCWRLPGEAESISETSTEDLFGGAGVGSSPRTASSECERGAQLLTKWPPNRKFDTSRSEIRDAIRRLATTSIEVLFMERFVQLAAPNGIIAVIVPEGIAAGDRHTALRHWLAGEFDLLASISLPQKIFTGVGANAKTTVVFARRAVPMPGREVLLACPNSIAEPDSLAVFFSETLAYAKRCAKIFLPA